MSGDFVVMETQQVQTNGKRKREDVTHTGHAQGTDGDSRMGNSDVIRREFRGNSDRKKGIQTNGGKQMPRLQSIFEAEATPSCPYIVLKGLLRGERERFRASRGSRHKRPDDVPTTWSRILLTQRLVYNVVLFSGSKFLLRIV